MELENIWLLNLKEINDLLDSKYKTVEEAAIIYVMKLYDENKLDPKQRFIVEHRKFKNVASKNDSLHLIYKELDIKFDNQYIGNCSINQLNTFLKVSDKIIGSLAHKNAVIVKLITDDLFDDDILTRSPFFQKKISDKKNIDDYASYIYDVAKITPTKIGLTMLKDKLTNIEENKLPSIIYEIEKLIKSYKVLDKKNVIPLVLFVIQMNDDTRDLIVDYISEYQIDQDKLVLFSDKKVKIRITRKNFIYLNKIGVLGGKNNDTTIMNLFRYDEDLDYEQLFNIAANYVDDADIYSIQDFLLSLNFGKDDKYMDKMFNQFTKNLPLYLELYEHYGKNTINFMYKFNNVHDEEKINEIFCYTSKILHNGFDNYNIDLVDDTVRLFINLVLKEQKTILFHDNKLTGLALNINYQTFNIERQLEKTLLLFDKFEDDNIKEILYTLFS